MSDHRKFSVSLPPDLLAALHDEAKRLGVPVNDDRECLCTSKRVKLGGVP